MKTHLQLRYFVLSLLVIAMTSLDAQQLVKFSFEEPTGTVSALDSMSGEMFPVSNHFDRPERITGVNGSALRLDSYSTWVSLNPFPLQNIDTKLTVQAWYATEAFNYENSSIVSQQTSDAGFSLSIGRYGQVVFEFFADDTTYNFVSENSIQKYSWNHIVGMVDLDESFARVYVNGELWINQSLAQHNALNLSQTQALFIGRHSIYQAANGFPIMALNGAIDEVSVFNTIMSEITIISNYEKYKDSIPDLTIDPGIRHAGDHLRPKYHPMPNTSWTNESYGLTYFDNKYHMFFQKNPNAPHLFFMHWGHVSSPDLVDWTEEKVALDPSPGFDSFGVWSGTTVMNHSNEPVIFYTGVDGVKAGIGGALRLDDDLISWVEFPENPLIPNPPPEYQHMDFRDPFLWKADSTYYMIVGSGLQNNGGGILFTYRSNDLIYWENIPPLYSSSNVSLTGKFWEMPVFYPINDSIYLLALTPIPTPTKPAETIYWLGTWENEIFTPYQAKPKKLELIQKNLLSPAVGTDEENRITYIGIIPEDRPVESQVEAGWRNTFSIPRVIRLLNDTTIGQVPHPNLCRLRGEHTQITDREILPGTTFNLNEFESTQCELEFWMKASDSSVFQIQLLKNAVENEVTVLQFDMINDMISLDRRFSSLSNATADVLTDDYTFNPNDTVYVRIFIDRSTIEVFIDNLTVFSCRAYPSLESSNKIDAIAETGPLKIIEMNAWQLKSFGDTMSNDVCEPAFLPETFFEDTVKPGHSSVPEQGEPTGLLIYPNPAQDYIDVVANHNSGGEASIQIFNMLGECIRQFQLSANSSELIHRIVTKNFGEGMYFLRFSQEGLSTITRFLVLDNK